MGDYVIIINVEKVIFIVKKEEDKVYYYYLGYLGGLKSIIAVKLRVKKFIVIVEKVIYGMFLYIKLGNK